MKQRIPDPNLFILLVLIGMFCAGAICDFLFNLLTQP